MTRNATVNLTEGPRLARLMAASIFVVFPCVVALGTWAATAPLSSAAIASGELVVETRRKTVQHLEGGVIESILVAEHEAVARNQPLVVVSAVAQREQFAALIEKLAEAMAQRVRLLAERDGDGPPDFHALDRLPDLADDRRQQLKLAHIGHLAARRAALGTRLDHVLSQKEQSLLEAEGFRLQLAAAERKLELARREQEAIQRLIENNSTTLARQREIERALIEQEAQRDSAQTGIQRALRASRTAELEVESIKAAARSAVLDEIKAIDAVVPDWQAQIVTLRDDIRRRIARAPVAGRVMDLQVHTEGSVLSPGGRLMDVVPLDDRPIIHARVAPNDIDLVQIGGEAQIVLSSFSTRKVPKLPATVLSVSADIHVRQETGEKYYLVRAELKPSAIGSLPRDVKLVPGMHVQMFVLGEARTVMSYVLDPITQSLGRSLRED
jgi:epimerase transport system membrane fusion protein